MPGLSFGSFETILRSYITPKITRQKLVNLLLLSPKVDARNKDKELQRDTLGVEKSDATKICNGNRNVPGRILEFYSASDALEYIKLCFSIDIEPRIQNSARDALLQEILDLIQND